MNNCIDSIISLGKKVKDYYNSIEESQVKNLFFFTAIEGETNSVKPPDTNFKGGLDTHQKYRNYVFQILQERKQDKETIDWIKTYISELLSVFDVDFDPIHSRLAALYSPKKVGKPPYDPQSIIRSLLLMVLFKETSITHWTNRVKTDSLMALFCGFKGRAAGIGTYYDLLERLENGPFIPNCPHRVLPSEQRRARCRLRPPKRKPDESEEKKEAPHDVIKKLAKEVIEKESQPIPNDLTTLLNEILMEVAVKVSIKKNLITSSPKFTLASDGSVIPSWAACNGIPTCDCKKNGIYDCSHPRRFSDVDAAWGWDNREKDFIFGYRFLQFVAADNRHDLPIYVCIDSANAHEVVMAIPAIDRFYKMNRYLLEARIDRFSADSIYDAYGFYEYLVHKKTHYAIPYRTAPARCIPLGNDGQMFNPDGLPLCKGGLPMRRHGKNKQGRRVFACPVKRLARRNGKKVYIPHPDECPLGSLCEPDSKLGPIYSVPSNIDPRIHPTILRGGVEYQELVNMRTCAERSNSAKKHTFLMKFTRTRVMPYAFIRLVLISIIEHSRVWVQEKLEKIDLKSIDPVSLFS